MSKNILSVKGPLSLLVFGRVFRYENLICSSIMQIACVKWPHMSNSFALHVTAVYIFFLDTLLKHRLRRSPIHQSWTFIDTKYLYTSHCLQKSWKPLSVVLSQSHLSSFHHHQSAASSCTVHLRLLITMRVTFPLWSFGRNSRAVCMLIP